MSIRKGRFPLFAFASIVATGLLWPGALRAELEVEDLLEIPFEELLQLKIEVAITSPTETAASIREAPAILAVVTAEEIAAMGARDLIDILRHVPGFSFGWDTQQATGLAFRGNWAIEGKILLMIDGFELDERRFAIAQIGNRISVDSIKRVEIIRGPGSVLYGGFAELAVINIITRSADDLDGGRV